MTRKQRISQPWFQTRKGETVKYSNMKMNDDVYALRSKVINHIRTAKRLLKSEGIELPRIDVRVIEHETADVINGMASLGQNIVWMPVKAFSRLNEEMLERVVFHELIHAVKSVSHINSCPLMTGKGCTGSTMSRERMYKIFIGYFKG